MGNDLTYDLDLSGLVRLEIAAFGPFDQGGQFLSDLGLKLALLLVVEDLQLVHHFHRVYTLLRRRRCS